MIRNPQYLALVRHGLSRANVAIRSSTDSLYYEIAGSDRNVELVDEGHTQAAQSGQTLSGIFPGSHPIDRLIESGFKRVVQTDDAIVAALGYCPPRTEDRRLEKRSYGRFWNLTYTGVEQLYPAEFQRFKEEGPLLYRAPDGGENYPDVFDRVQSFIDEEIMPSSDNLLVGTHSIVMLAFKRAFEGLSDSAVLRQYEQQELPNGHILLYVRQGPGSPWLPAPLIASVAPSMVR